MAAADVWNERGVRERWYNERIMREHASTAIAGTIRFEYFSG